MRARSLPDSAHLAKKVWGHRTIPPEETLDRLKPHLKTMGITRLADVTGLDRIGIPVVQAIRPMGRSLSVAQGKGPDLAAAMTSAAMEAAEGWHAEDLQLATCRGTLAKAMGDFPFDTLPHRGEFDETKVISFVGGKELLSGEDTWLPADFIHKDYTRAAEMACFCRSTNGLASGNTLEEALASALHEVVERDALADFEWLDQQERRQRRVDPQHVAALHPVLAELIAKIEEAGLTLFLLNLTNDLGVPALRAELGESGHTARGQGQPVSSFHVGSGCHLDPATAAIRAITEAAQSRLTQIAGSRDDLADRCYQPAAFSNLTGMLEHSADRIAYGFGLFDYPDESTDTPAGDVRRLTDKLKAAGVGWIGWADLSRANLPINVVRVLIPGLGYQTRTEAVRGSRHSEEAPK